MSIKSNLPIDVFHNGVYRFSSPLDKMKEVLAENAGYVIKQGGVVIHRPADVQATVEGEETYEDVVGYDF